MPSVELIRSRELTDQVPYAYPVVSDCFGDHDAPSTLLGVAVLGHPDQLVEVEAVAALSCGVWSCGRPST